MIIRSSPFIDLDHRGLDPEHDNTVSCLTPPCVPPPDHMLPPDPPARPVPGLGLGHGPGGARVGQARGLQLVRQDVWLRPGGGGGGGPQRLPVSGGVLLQETQARRETNRLCGLSGKSMKLINMGRSCFLEFKTLPICEI